MVLCPHKYHTFYLTLTNLCIYSFLEPNKTYDIHVVARAEKNLESNSSNVIRQFTEVDGPSPPIIINATCILNNNVPSIFLNWTKLEHDHESVDEYKLFVFTDDNILVQSTVIKNNSIVCQ